MAKHSKSTPDTKKLSLSEFARRGGLKGGPARMAQLSAEERVALASKAGKAATAKLSKKERSDRARKAVLARWAKKEAKTK